MQLNMPMRLDRTRFRRRLRLWRRRVARQKIRLKQFYHRHEKYFPVASFLLGFLYDSLTLKRIDQFTDNLILLVYLLLAGGLILLIGLIDTGQIRHDRILRYRGWYPNVLQFLLGGLFSAYVIFYFKSAALGKSLVFVGLMAALLLVNEFLHHKLLNITLLCTLYFFAVFAFLTFFIPIVAHSISRAMFFYSGGMAFLFAALLVTAIYRKVLRQMPRLLVKSTSPSVLVFAVLGYLYMENWIPPVPLSLKEAGIYHHVHKASDRYVVQYYRPSRYHFWIRDDRRFQYVSGDTVFCFASIFAPIDMQAAVYHRWQVYDTRQQTFQQTDLLQYRISGGRAGGYRGYTYKRHVRPGRWRVDVETETGQVLGRIDFTVEAVEVHRGRQMVAIK